jgi:hypothetical protein
MSPASDCQQVTEITFLVPPRRKDAFRPQRDGCVSLCAALANPGISTAQEAAQLTAKYRLTILDGAVI